MELNAAIKKRLRARAHSLKPIVLIGQNGYSAAVAAAIDEALADHGLIKVRLRGIESERRKQVVLDICRDLDTECVGLLGSVATLFRPLPETRQ